MDLPINPPPVTEALNGWMFIVDCTQRASQSPLQSFPICLGACGVSRMMTGQDREQGIVYRPLMGADRKHGFSLLSLIVMSLQLVTCQTVLVL